MRARPAWMRRIDAVDRLIYRGEQWACGAIFVGMILVMALNVAHRVFSRPQGRLSAAVVGIAAQCGVALDLAFAHGALSLGLNLAIGFALALMAVRRGAATQGWPWPKSLAAAAGLTAGAAAAVWMLLAALPNGLVWGPTAAMAAMLWTGFLGASLATYEKRHLALEMADKLWPARAQRAVKGAGLAVTAALCLLLCWLAWSSLRMHVDTWMADPEAGTLQPTGWPRWLLLLALPLSWTVISLRFFGEGVRVALGIEAPEVAEDRA